jgi:uncharacterized membrane protein YdbT with pleckstrin-like domain
MKDEGLTKPGPAPRRYRRHWVTLVQPMMIAAIGLGLLRISTEFYHSAVGIRFIVAALREIGSAVGPVAEYWAWQGLAPIVICAIVWTCGRPLVWALAVNATTTIEVDERQIVFCAGVFARQIRQVEIREIVGINVLESMSGRMLGYGTFDVETRGYDRLVTHMIGRARDLSGFVLWLKHRPDQN